MHSSESGDPGAIRQVWGLASPSRRGPQAKLTLAEVVDEGIRVADVEGLDAVTLARVARGLGLTTTGLYRYVDSKDTLEELMVDAALGRGPALRGDDPSARVLAWVEALWRRCTQHAWLAQRLPRRTPRCPNAYAWLASLVTEIRAAGDPRPLATAVTIDTLVRGYAQQALLATLTELSPELAEEVGRRHPELAAEGQPRIEPHADLLDAVGRLVQSR